METSCFLFPRRFLPLLGAGFLLASGAFADERDLSPPPELCHDVKEIPGIAEIRTKGEELLNGPAKQLKEALGTLQGDCLKVRSQGMAQSGPLLESIREQTQAITGENGLQKKFETSAAELESLMKPAYAAIGGALGHKKCSESMNGFQRWIGQTKFKLSASLREKCDLGTETAERASLAGDRLGGRATMSAGLSEREMEAALLNPRDPNSAKLLDVAKAYQASLPLELNVPSPAKNERDRVCGEACVAVLSLHRAEVAYGKDSPEWKEALEVARSTQHGVFGRTQ